MELAIKDFTLVEDKLPQKSGVYIIVFPSEKFYIGSSNNFRVRFRSHLSKALKDKHENPFLKSLIKKYKSSFKVYVYLCDNYTDLEQKLIDVHYDNPLCVNMSKEVGKPGKRIHKGKPLYQYNLSGKFIKEWPSLSSAAKHYNIQKSRIYLVLEGKRRMTVNSQWSRVKVPKMENINKGKNVGKKGTIICQYDLSGVFISSYKSCAEALRHIKNLKRTDRVCSAIIVDVLNKNDRTSCGYYWTRLSNRKDIPKKIKVKPPKLKEINIIQKDINNNVIKFWKYSEHLRKEGFSLKSIWRVTSGQRLTYKGFIWEKT